MQPLGVDVCSQLGMWLLVFSALSVALTAPGGVAEKWRAGRPQLVIAFPVFLFHLAGSLAQGP